jgi:D-sedoheptulose 7-phosphate isomerase
VGCTVKVERAVAVEDVVRSALREGIAVKQALLADLEVAGEIGSRLVDALAAGGKLVLFGNGGSAADAQHVAAELVNRFRRERGTLPAIALTADSSVLTSIGNDYSFEEVFARQVEALVGDGDVVVGLSTSGTSSNVCRGIEVAREKGAFTIGFTGQSGGRIASLADLCFRAPSEDTARIQEVHIAVWHALCDVVETTLFAS